MLIKMQRNVCVVPECDTKVNEETVFKFPTKIEDGKKWLDAIKNASLNDFLYANILKMRFFVCKKHFTPLSFNKTCKNTVRLNHGAVPTLYLPNIDEGSLYYVYIEFI